MSTEQLRALRDAVVARCGQVANDEGSQIPVRMMDMHRAIAALEAEGAKACEGFVCSGKLINGAHVYHDILFPADHSALPGTTECRCTCGQPFSAHQQPIPLVHGPKHGCAQAQQTAERRVAKTVRREGEPSKATWTDDDLDDIGRARLAQQPARTAVPVLYSTAGECERIMHAAALAIAAERDAALRESKLWDDEASFQGDRADRAERERDEARAELAALKAQIDGESRRNRCRAQKAESEIAMLKAQEPVGRAYTMHYLNAVTRPMFEFRGSTAWVSNDNKGVAVYAAPVATIPLAQHEAALAEARRDERERCAKVCEGLSDLDLYVRESSALMEAGAAIRALPDGGEG